MSQRIQLLAKSALALVSNVRLNGLVWRKDYNLSGAVFQSRARALCFVKRLANFLMTMSHLVFSFVPIISQPPATGFSALTGYGGRCTARTVSEETKKNSPIIIATNVSFMTAGGRVDVFSFSSSFYGSARTKFSKNLEGRFDSICAKPAQLEGGRRNRRNLRNGQLPSRASA
jgi:hypothetical protein